MGEGEHRLGPVRVGIGGWSARQDRLDQALLPRLAARNLDVAVVTNDLVAARMRNGCKEVA